MGKKQKTSNMADHLASMRRTAHEEYVEAMRNGVRLRPQTFRSGKEYKRKQKHGGWA